METKKKIKILTKIALMAVDKLPTSYIEQDKRVWTAFDLGKEYMRDDINHIWECLMWNEQDDRETLLSYIKDAQEALDKVRSK